MPDYSLDRSSNVFESPLPAVTTTIQEVSARGQELVRHIAPSVESQPVFTFTFVRLARLDASLVYSLYTKLSLTSSGSSLMDRSKIWCQVSYLTSATKLINFLTKMLVPYM